MALNRREACGEGLVEHTHARTHACAHARTRTHARTQTCCGVQVVDLQAGQSTRYTHARTHTHTHIHTHTRARAHTHTHTHTHFFFFFFNPTLSQSSQLRFISEHNKSRSGQEGDIRRCPISVYRRRGSCHQPPTFLPTFFFFFFFTVCLSGQSIGLPV